MREEVEEAEQDRGGFLHAHEAVERPFAVELENWLEVRRFARESLVGHDMLAGIVALCWAVPEEKAMLERYCLVLAEINVQCREAVNTNGYVSHEVHNSPLNNPSQ